ncbi:CHAP domain-containing protein, partial [Streptococcus iniae]
MADNNWLKNKREENRSMKENIVQQSSKLQELKPRQAIKTAKEESRHVKQELKAFKREYVLAKKGKDLEVLKEAKRNLILKKTDYKVRKAVTQSMIKRNGGTAKQKFARKGYQSSRRTTEALVAEQDTLGDIAEARRKNRQMQASANQSKKMAKYTKKIATESVKGSYSSGNKVYNMARGRGFTRTAKVDRWETKLLAQTNRLKRRIVRTKVGKTTKATTKTIKFLGKPILTILKSPLRIKSYLILFLVALVVAIFAGSAPGTVQQDEFDLNKSWLQLSKRDREKSNDEVDYWTNIDDVLFYMNFKYGGEWTPETKWDDGRGGKLSGALGFNHYSDALNDVWNNLNKDIDNLKTISDVIDSVKWMKLDKHDKEEYKELLELSKEVGRYPNYQDLANPFYDESDEVHALTPLVIIKRFGYTSTSKVYEGSQIKAETGKTLKAVMSGIVHIDKTDLQIKSSDAIFTYNNVSGLRVKDGQKVTAGDDVATIKTNGYQEVHYQKLEAKATKESKEKWSYVNPGFYFTFVTYNQTTSVKKNLNLLGDLATKSKLISDFIKKKIPNATDNGISSMLGNFATESNVTAKRAESDYLKPPVGASSDSWDDDAWLNMGFAEGASVGSLVKHRGLGLGMWTDTFDGAIRNTLLREYAKKKNKKWYDLELQIDFMLEGDNPYYINQLKAILTSNDDVNTLTKRFLNNWEGNAGD